jgi:hypothetical protein
MGRLGRKLPVPKLELLPTEVLREAVNGLYRGEKICKVTRRLMRCYRGLLQHHNQALMHRHVLELHAWMQETQEQGGLRKVAEALGLMGDVTPDGIIESPELVARLRQTEAAAKTMSSADRMLLHQTFTYIRGILKAAKQQAEEEAAAGAPPADES